MRASSSTLSLPPSSLLPPHLMLGTEAGDAVALLPKAGDGEAVLVLAAGQAASAGLADGRKQGGRGLVEERGLEAHRARGARRARALGRRVGRFVGVDGDFDEFAGCWLVGRLDELETNRGGEDGDARLRQAVEVCWIRGWRDGGHIGVLHYGALCAIAAPKLLTTKHR